jgi:hypothetical protein
MNRSEVEQVLQLAERRERVAQDLELRRSLEAEIARDEEIAAAVPGLVAALERHAVELEATARELERQWVAQGPLVSLWSRAAEQLQLAETTDVDPEPYRADVARARERVETARLDSGRQKQVLERERSGVAAVLGELPVEVDPPPELHEDDRPEELRRDALQLIELAGAASLLARDEQTLAAERLEVAQARLRTIEPAQELERELTELDARLPREVDVPSGVPPSFTQRLIRAGIGISGADA